MTDEEMEVLLNEAGYVVDHGNLIEGYFIPDGTVRVYSKINGPYSSVVEGETLEEVFERINLT